MSATVDLGGKRAFVTGGTRGIGAEVARALSRAGAFVALGYREDDESAARTLAEVKAGGGDGVLVKANLVRPEEARAAVETASGGAGLDVLVHAAALGSFKPALELKPNQWDLTLQVNARAFLVLAQEAARAMAGRPGRIVALSSLGASRVVPLYGAIGISKAALEATVRALAVELGPRGITVNTVSAGYVEGTSIRLHPASEALAAEAVARTPLGRLARAEDVADAVLFLVCPLASFVTGQVLLADGGLSLGL